MGSPPNYTDGGEFTNSPGGALIGNMEGSFPPSDYTSWTWPLGQTRWTPAPGNRGDGATTTTRVRIGAFAAGGADPDEQSDPAETDAAEGAGAAEPRESSGPDIAACSRRTSTSGATRRGSGTSCDLRRRRFTSTAPGPRRADAEQQGKNTTMTSEQPRVRTRADGGE